MRRIFAALKSLLKKIFAFFADSDSKGENHHKKAPIYRYRRKEYLMTSSEARFMRILLEVVGDSYRVFPQIHLSAVLDHEVKGQTWKHAFNHINSKSVDFVISDKEQFRPLVAIELDDKTHEWQSRRLRDEEVERIFTEAKLPLVRFSSLQSNDVEAVRQSIFTAIEEVGSNPKQVA